MIVEMFSIEQSSSIRLSGELDMSSAPELDRVLEAAVEHGGAVLVDLSELTFMDSTGIQAFLKAKNAELEGLKQASEEAGQAFRKLQGRKRREEERLFDVVAHFVSGADNPVTTSGAKPASPPPTKPGPA